ncbi:peptide chain release factor 2 [Candidatus Soleaferrea massiliensis]|uniref:peptide chain release factor 2 n=1 Tax=Candidatus Soleaferrea massiliensis TaxID=1470354 RepID=UPI00058B7637|nr:peptide chain release factor 2 [Candidatus Soleaferrea massiliensis]
MLQFEELKQQLTALKPQIDDLAEAIGLSELQKKLGALEEQGADPAFWNDLEQSQKTLQQTTQIKSKIGDYNRLVSLYEDISTLIEIALEEQDEALYTEAEQTFQTLVGELETQKLSTLLSGEYDGKNAILTFHAGAGGTEAQDWVEMLYRMYTHWAEKHKFKVKVLDYLDGDEAGIKSASILIEGINAYGFLKSEAGVHRLVRVSPFDASGRRHTSFASLEVMPEIDDAVDVEINESDLKVDTYRASGAGGQHVNKTESAIRITHLPTGIVVACQNERSQHQNREVAMKMLISKLTQIKEREHLDKIGDIKGEQKDIAWGSQIRSYVFMPYTLAKDHRTGYEMGNINAVMDGDIDGFINAYLKAKSLGQI